MGILDAFDDPNFMANLFGFPASKPPAGIGSDYVAAPDAGYPTTAPMPQPRPAAAPQPTQGDLSNYVTENNLPPGAGFNLGGGDFLPHPNVASAGLPVGQPPAIPPSQPSPEMAPPLPPPQEVGYAPGNAPQVPLPPTDPRSATPLSPSDPRASTALAARAAPLAPQSGVAMPPPSAGVVVPGAASGDDGLANQLGIPRLIEGGMAQGLQPGSRFGQALAGLGKGLSAVGQLRPGASAGQAFAAGAGGALTGDYEASEKAKQQLFSNSSGAFKEYLAALGTGDKMQIDQARAKLFNSQAEAIMAGRGKSGTGGAWQNTPFGRVIQVENEVSKYANQQRLQIQRQIDTASPDEQRQMQADLEKKVEGYRNRLYSASGIDPKQAQRLRNAGVDQKNPIDTGGMNQDQFDAMVPMGAWYQAKGADGKVHVLQRVRPPAGAAAPQRAQRSAAVNPQESAAVLYNAGQE